MALHDILVRVGADTDGFINGITKATAAVAAFGASAVSNVTEAEVRTVGSLGAITTGFATATAISTAAVVGLVAVAAQYEQAFADVRKTTDATEEQFTQLSRSFREMSLEMPETAVEITRVGAAAGQLGVEVENMEAFTEVMIKLGVAAENLSAEEAAQQLARLMNIMGTSYGDVDRLGSTITDLGNNLATTERDIVNLAMRLAGAGAQVNMSEADVLSFAGALSSLGLRTEMAGTAFSRVMLNMNTAVMEGGAELETFARVSGMTVDEFSRAFREDASMAIMAFIGGLGDMSESGENTIGVLNDLSLGEIRVRDTLLRTSEASDLLTRSLDIGRNAWEENTALQEEYEEKSRTLIARLQKLWNHLTYIAVVLGTVLMPVIMPVVEAVEQFAEKVVNLAKKLEDAGEETRNFWGKLILGVPTLLAVVTGILGLLTAITALKAALSAMAAVWGLTVSALLLVVGKIALAVAAAVALSVAIGTVISKLFGWLGLTNDASGGVAELNGRIDDLSASTEELTDSIDDSAKAFRDKQAAMEESAQANSDLMAQLQTLSEMENKTIGDKALLANVVEQLNQNISGLNLSYDEQTDSLSMSNEMVQARIDLMLEEERMIAAQERMVEIMRERNEVEAQLEEAIQLREEYSETLSHNSFMAEENIGKAIELQNAENELRATLEELDEQYEESTEVREEASNRITQIVKENNLDQISSYEDLEGANKELFEEMAKHYEDLRDAATDAFDRINTESKVSLDEMVANMEHNRKATEEWGKNRTQLMEWASREGHTGFMKWVDQLGIDHAGELAEMAKALDGSSAEQIRLLEELAKGYDENSDTAMEAFGENLEGGFDEFLDMQRKFVDDSYETMKSRLFDAGFHELGETIPEELEDGVDDKAHVVTDRFGILSNDIVTEFDGTPSSLYSVGTFAVTGLRRGIDDKEGEAVASARRVANRVAAVMKGALAIHSPSRVMRNEIGHMIGDGLTLGMEDKLQEIERMARKVSEYATPEVPKLAGLDVGDFRRQVASVNTRLSAEVSDFNVDRGDEAKTLREIRDELRSQKEMIVQLDGERVGEAVTPHVNYKNAVDKLGRYFD